MPTAGTETRLMGALATALGTIGVPPSSWLTTPTLPVRTDTPNDALGALTHPQVFLNFYRTDPAEGAGMTRHRATVQFVVWIASPTTTEMLNVKADVLRALFSSEGTFTQQFGQPFWPGTFQTHPEMQAAGNQLGSLTVTIDVEMDHSAP
jgi:hypothetical protein